MFCHTLSVDHKIRHTRFSSATLTLRAYAPCSAPLATIRRVPQEVTCGTCAHGLQFYRRRHTRDALATLATSYHVSALAFASKQITGCSHGQAQIQASAPLRDG